MADVDDQTLNQSHRDPNSAPPHEQHDPKKPKPIDQEQAMTTPEVSKRTPDAQYPMGGQVPRVGDREVTAAGFPGIFETMRFAAKEGPIKSARTLSVVNKKGGFDCPSCAWPDPDGERSF